MGDGAADVSPSRRAVRTAPLEQRRRTSAPGRGTDPGRHAWAGAPPGFRRFETTVRIGTGEPAWAAAVATVEGWQVKTRSGFVVSGPPGPVAAGRRYWVRMRLGPVAVAEPVEVAAVVRTADRAGFAYGTLDGHPVAGEEAFLVHRDPAGLVFFTLRSLTRPAPTGLWSVLFPVLLLAQRYYRHRYVRTMLRVGRDGGQRSPVPDESRDHDELPAQPEQ